MPYDANGNWTPEDDSVANKVAALQSTDSSLMRKAAAEGLRAANRRGLKNSSIAIGSGIAAGLAAVTPIASQDAAQINQKNLQMTDNQNQRQISAAQIAASDRAAYASQLTNLGSNYTTGMSNISANSKLPKAARASAQADMAAMFKSQQQQLAAIYGINNLTWSGGTSSSTSAPGSGLSA